MIGRASGYCSGVAVSPADILARLRTTPPRVTVVGDVLLDRWVRGSVHRLSREAPVPVVEPSGERECPGGAGNTAANLAAMGAHVRLVAAVGDDADGRALLRLLADAGVDVSDVVVRPGAETASKTRIVGEDQILVRVDRNATPAASAEGAELLPALQHPADALVVCDYGGGLFDDDAIRAIAGAGRPPVVLVDAHDVARWRTMHADVVTPNAGETELLLDERLPADRAGAVGARAERILAASGAHAAVVTLDRDGTVVLEGGAVTGRTRAHPGPEQQASGAGDTFAAALALALAVDAPLPDAAEFAQRAADVVVRQEGTAVCTAADLAAAVEPAAPLTDVPALRALVRAERERGRRIVFTNGCFDLLHRGHVQHLREAKALGDLLIVALNDDASVARLKGPGRPVTPLPERAAVLAALDSVDVVVAFGDDAPMALLEDLQPDVYAKGGDYTADMLAETAVVRRYGGEVRILDYLPAHSTSRIVQRIAAAPH